MATSRAPPTVSVPVLSNITVCVRASASSGPLPLMRMPRRRGLRYPGDEGDRRRQDERTWRRGDQHRERADGVARKPPRAAGDYESERATIAARSGRPSGQTAPLRFARRSTIRTIPAYVLSLAVVEARSSNVSPALTAPLRASSPALRLTGIGSPVTAASSSTATELVITPSTGMTSPARTKIRVTDSNLSTGTSSMVRVVPAMSDFWRAIDQRSQIPLGASDREILQNIAAGIHHRDDDPGEVLAERKRAGHRNKGDGVHPHSPRQEVADHRDE